MKAIVITTCVFLLGLWRCQQKPTLPDPLEAGWQGEKVCQEILNKGEQPVESLMVERMVRYSLE